MYKTVCCFACSSITTIIAQYYSILLVDTKLASDIALTKSSINGDVVDQILMYL